jgi:hypothetical protein
MSSSTPRKCGKCGRSCPAKARYCSFCGYCLSEVHLFFSYASKDEELREELEKHLSDLKNSGLITAWHDRMVDPGYDWAEQVGIHLNKAHIILLLISSDFMANGNCYGTEMQRALERHDLKEALVVPVLLRPVRFARAPFAKLQVLPKDGRPITIWQNQDSAFVDVAIGIEDLIQHHFRLPVQLVPVHQAFPECQSPSLCHPSPTLVPMTQDLSIYNSSSVERVSNSNLRSVMQFSRDRLRSLVRLHVLGGGHVLPQPLIVWGLMGSYNLVSTIIGFSRPPRPVMLSVPIQSILFNHLLFFLFREVERIKYLVEQAGKQGIFTILECFKLFVPGSAYQTFLERQYDERAYRGDALCRFYQLVFSGTNPTGALAVAADLVSAPEKDYLFERKLVLGREAFTRAIDYDPSPATYVSLGNTLAKLARYDEALVAYKWAVELDPTFATAYSDMADTLEQLGRNEEAQQAREKAKQYGYEG